MIGDEVEITIVDVRGDKVRLGITAPKSIPVHRREIYDAIQREKAQKDAEVHADGNNKPVERTEDPLSKKADKSEKAPQK
jgi:carbon storage regulator